VKFGAIIFILIGLASLVGGLFFAYDTQKKIETWVEVEGTIVVAEVVKSAARYGTGYCIEVTYEYEFEGKKYECMISPGGTMSGTGAREAKAREAANYTVGSARKLSVNPSNPEQVSYALGYNLGSFWGVFLAFGLGLVFLVVGIMIMKPPKISMGTIVKFIPRAFIIIGISFAAGASLAYINNPESLTGPIFFWIFGLSFIVVPILYLRNQARGAVKTEVSVSLGKAGRYAISEANGIATVLYAPDKKHLNTEEQFLQEVAQFAARAMDEVGHKENISKIDVWAEGQIQLQDSSGQRVWKGVRLVLNKENWRGPMFGGLSNYAYLDAEQFLRLCSLQYIDVGEFPEWPKIDGGSPV